MRLNLLVARGQKRGRKLKIAGLEKTALLRGRTDRVARNEFAQRRVHLAAARAEQVAYGFQLSEGLLLLQVEFRRGLTCQVDALDGRQPCAWIQQPNAMKAEPRSVEDGQVPFALAQGQRTVCLLYTSPSPRDS